MEILWLKDLSIDGDATSLFASFSGTKINFNLKKMNTVYFTYFFDIFLQIIETMNYVIFGQTIHFKKTELKFLKSTREQNLFFKSSQNQESFCSNLEIYSICSKK